MGLQIILAQMDTPGNMEEMVGYNGQFNDPFYVFGSLAVAGLLIGWYYWNKKKGKEPW